MRFFSTPFLKQISSPQLKKNERLAYKESDSIHKDFRSCHNDGDGRPIQAGNGNAAKLTDLAALVWEKRARSDSIKQKRAGASGSTDFLL